MEDSGRGEEPNRKPSKWRRYGEAGITIMRLIIDVIVIFGFLNGGGPTGW